MKHAHNEMVRMRIGRKIDEKKMFAVWRIDAPWKPIVKRGAVKYSLDLFHGNNLDSKS